jgi:hypothetical protein
MIGEGYIFLENGELRQAGDNVWIVGSCLEYDQYLETPEGDLEVDPSVLIELICIDGPRKTERVQQWRDTVGNTFVNVEPFDYTVLSLNDWIVEVSEGDLCLSNEHVGEHGYTYITLEGAKLSTPITHRRYIIGDLVDRGATMRRKNG